MGEVPLVNLYIRSRTIADTEEPAAEVKFAKYQTK
jgi:hypothetical protein